MKFTYEYQDKANKRHKGVLSAPTRAAAYAELKTRGIKPIRCEEAPGFFNLLFGKGKRWIAIAALGVVCLVLAGVIRSMPDSVAYASLDASTRRQLIGDTAIIEKGVRTGWSDVFELEGDRFLASFAIPGVVPAIRATTGEELEKALRTKSAIVGPDLSLEARQIVAIVSGMKEEIANLISAGWTLGDVGAALVSRQEQEISYYERAKTEIETALASGMTYQAVEDLLDQRNDSLRKLGIRLVSMPETAASGR